MDFGTLNDRQIEAVEATEGHVRIVRQYIPQAP